MTTGRGQTAEPFGAIEPAAARDLLMAALDAFAERGYHATTTREIGQRAGLSPAAMYVHYASKSDLLYAICDVGHRAVLEDARAALAGVTGPAARVAAFTEAFVAWHARNHTLARVIQYEMRSLAPERLAEIGAVRQEFTRIVGRELRAGVRADELAAEDVTGTTLAILSLGIDVARWYDPGRSRSPRAVGRLYAKLVTRMLDVR